VLGKVVVTLLIYILRLLSIIGLVWSEANTRRYLEKRGIGRWWVEGRGNSLQCNLCGLYLCRTLSVRAPATSDAV
jgi:hypothetical protein